jgi:lysophospholipase L1-like esterase
MNIKTRAIYVRIIFTILMVLFIGILFEGGARIIYTFKDEIKTLLGTNVELDLDIYEMPDMENPGHWVLKASTSWTFGQLLKAKTERGAILGVSQLQKLKENYGLSSEDVAFQINKKGFKGPEIDENHIYPRILAIGDSCTFGTWLDNYTYPRSLERSLTKMGYPVEVINAGVEGYAPHNVLYRIEELKALHPEFTTIYIGWNAIFNNNEEMGLVRYLYSVRLFEKAWEKFLDLTNGKQAAAINAYEKPKNLDRNSVEISKYDSYTPTFLNDLEEIIHQMQSIGSKLLSLLFLDYLPMMLNPQKKRLKWDTFQVTLITLMSLRR